MPLMPLMTMVQHDSAGPYPVCKTGLTRGVWGEWIVAPQQSIPPNGYNYLGPYK